MIILGVIADTHIPDRKRRLNPQVAPIFAGAGVEAVLHAGDVSVPRVLEELGKIAPVYAVRGNRDLWRLGHLPSFMKLKFNGVPLLLTHGHGHLWEYLIAKARYLIYGQQPERYKLRLRQNFPASRVIVFGHLHIPINDWINQQLLFNPGSACCPDVKNVSPSVGLLRIQAEGQVKGEIIYLR